MSQTDWKGIAELIGITAIVASLIFVGLQMKQADDIARYERYSNASNPIELANSLSVNREVWLKGCAGDELSAEDWFTFVNLVDLVTIRRNARWEIINLIDAQSLSAPDVAVFRHALDLYSNPGMHQAWQARNLVREQTSYYLEDENPNRRSFTKEVKASLKQIEGDPPKVLSDGPLCGVR